MTKTKIIYVDDEPRNLNLFQLMFDESGIEVLTFGSAVEALSVLKTSNPAVIVTDQRMPGMTGLEFLEIAAQILPDVPRIVITGQTDEDTIVKLVRRAKLFDYISKPVIEDDVVGSIQRAVDYSLNKRDLVDTCRKLESKAAELEAKNHKLEELRRLEIAAREEAEAWSSVELVHAITSGEVKFPIERDIVCLTFDIVGSKKLHGIEVNGMGLRQHVVGLFMTSLLNFEGCLEGHGGDGAYGHFGTFCDFTTAANRALATAQEFRQRLKNLERIHSTIVECGIAIHVARKAKIDAHTASIARNGRTLVKKTLYSSSPEIDYVFSLEEIGHHLPGTNIILGAEVKNLISTDCNALSIGKVKLNSLWGFREIFIIKSDKFGAGDFRSLLQGLEFEAVAPHLAIAG